MSGCCAGQIAETQPATRKHLARLTYSNNRLAVMAGIRHRKHFIQLISGLMIHHVWCTEKRLIRLPRKFTNHRATIA
jgi:hypothetical protein